MPDIISKKKRSEIMSTVRSKDSKIETGFRKAIWREGFRYSKNSTKYFGKPDLVLKKHRTVIFIDSCFWHGCPYHCRMPKSNVVYWRNKIKRNKERDKEVNKFYKKRNWRVLRFWEHEVLNSSERVINKVIKFLKN